MLDSILIISAQSLQDIRDIGALQWRLICQGKYPPIFLKKGKRVIELKARVDSGNASYDEIRTLNEVAKKTT